MNAAYNPLDLGAVSSDKQGGIEHSQNGIEHETAQYLNGGAAHGGAAPVQQDGQIPGTAYANGAQYENGDASQQGPRQGQGQQAPEEYLNGNLRPAATAIPASASQASIQDPTRSQPAQDVTEPTGVKTQVSEEPRKQGQGLMPPAPLGVAPELGEEGRMEPHLQLMCGPLLSYYTVKDGVWQGGALVVTADAYVLFKPH